MATHVKNPLFVWKHIDQEGQVIGEIRRFINIEGRKQDIPCYYPNGQEFKPGIPETLKKIKYPLFGLESFKDKSRVLIICEGQKTQSAFAGLGFQCVTSILGANHAHLSNWQVLARTRLIYLVPDQDEAGEAYTKTVFNILNELASSLSYSMTMKIVRLPHLPPKGDICDWLKQQPELNHWNELDSLALHPAKTLLQGRLQRTLTAHLHSIPSEWVNVPLSVPVSTPDPTTCTPSTFTPTTHIHIPLDWPDPQPIQKILLPIKTLSTILIPEPYRDWIVDVAERMQCPMDFIAVTAMVVSASLIGTRCGIKPKQKDDWLVIPNLWGGLIGRPGMLKTPAMNEAIQFLSQLEKEAKNTFDAESKQYQAQLALYQSEREVLKSEIICSQKQRLKHKQMEGSQDPNLLKQQFLHLEEPQKPKWKRFKTNDATIEKLSSLLADNPTGLLLYRDELIGLLSTWDKRGHESDRAFFLEAWNGNGSHTTDRIGRGTVHTEQVCLSIFGSTQPAKLTRYLYHAIRGMDNDGLLQRFQLLVYPDELKSWQLIDREPNQIAKERVFTLLKKLTEIDFVHYGATKEKGDRFAYFRFDQEALAVFYHSLTKFEHNQLRQEEQPIMVEHLSKYRSLMPSLALIFHVINMVEGEGRGHDSNISIMAAECAIAWCDYLEGHARRIYGLVKEGIFEATARLAQKIEEGALTHSFSLRDVYRKGWGLLDDKESAQQACDELIEIGWLRQEFNVQNSPQKVFIYSINPKVKRKETKGAPSISKGINKA